MNPAELPLKDIHLPMPISWWPLAPGWWVMAVLLIFLVLGLVWLYKRLTRKTALKSARKMFRALQEDQQQSDFEKLCALSVLIRRTAISIYPRAETAALTGDEWLSLLDSVMPDQPFSSGVGNVLINAPYQRPEQQELAMAEIMALCESWLKAIAKVKL